MTEARKVIKKINEVIISEGLIQFSYDKSKKRLDVTNNDYKEIRFDKNGNTLSPTPTLKILKNGDHGNDAILIPNRLNYYKALSDAYKIFKDAGYDLSGQEDYEVNQF